ncbi:MAG: hypothetical protein ABH829_04460 [archaeon]
MRGQNYLGFLVSSVVLLIVVAYAASSMVDIVVPALEDRQEMLMEVRAYSIFHQLVSSPGYKASWEASPGSVEFIGLAEEYGTLSSAKLQALKKASPEKIKQSFGDEYDYQICLGGCGAYSVSTSSVVESQSEVFVQFPVAIDDGTYSTLRVVVR